MKINQMKLSDIKPYPNNPRRNAKAVDKVVDSITQYGFQQPLVVDKDNVIIVGHTRYQASRKLALETVPVVVASELDEEQANAYRLMDNRSGEYADWDFSLLKTEMDTLFKDDIPSLSYETGFSEAEIKRMYPDEVIEQTIDGDGEEFVSQEGDIWILGDHRLMHGSSANTDHINQVMDGKKIDMIWEDPPYGVSYGQGAMATRRTVFKDIDANTHLNKHEEIQNDTLSKEELDEFLVEHMKVLTPYVKNGAPIYWAHDIRFNNQFEKILEDAGYNVNDTLIWKKNRQSMFTNDYAKYYEPILYGWKKGAEHKWYATDWHPNAYDVPYEDMEKDELVKILNSINTNYQKFKKETRKTTLLHPTVKPVALIAYHLHNSSKKDDIIFDGFSGSGSTLMACEKTKRKARVIEIESKYVDRTIQRWQESTGMEAYRESDGKTYNELKENL